MKPKEYYIVKLDDETLEDAEYDVMCPSPERAHKLAKGLVDEGEGYRIYKVSVVIEETEYDSKNAWKLEA